MPFFFHPDLKSQYFHFQFLSQGHLNIYQYLANNKSSLPYQDTFNYLPLTYFTFGSINIISSPLHLPGFTNWINDWGPNKYSDPNIPYYLLIVKLPYLIFDLLFALFIFKLTHQRKYAYIWLFNPLTIYLIYILGNFDILPALLTIISLYFLNLKKNHFSLFFLGTAVALKLYPLLFLPFFLINIKQNFKKIFYSGLFFLLPIILTFSPFLFSQEFYASFLGSGLTQKLLEFRIQNIPILPIFYIIIFVYSYIQKIPIHHSIFLLSLIFFPLVKFHPQWIIWFYPFCLLTINDLPRLKIPLIIFTLFLLIYIIILNDQFLTFGHLIPIDPSFLNVRTPYELIRYRFLINPQIIQNYIRWLIAASSLISFIVYEKTRRNHR